MSFSFVSYEYRYCCTGWHVQHRILDVKTNACVYWGGEGQTYYNISLYYSLHEQILVPPKSASYRLYQYVPGVCGGTGVQTTADDAVRTAEPVIA